MSRQDVRPVVEGPTGHFGDDRALALPGFARHQQDRTPLAGVGLPDGGRQCADLLRPTDDPDVGSEQESLGQGDPSGRREERRGGGAGPSGPGWHTRQGEICRLLEHLPLEELEFVAGLDPLLLDEDAPDAPVSGHGIGLPTAPVQGDHQLGPEPFAVGVPRHQRLELGHDLCVASECQIDVDP